MSVGMMLEGTHAITRIWRRDPGLLLAVLVLVAVLAAPLLVRWALGG